MQVIEEGAATARHELVLRLKRVEGQLRGIQPIEHPEFTLNRKETKDRRIQRMARALARLA